MMMMMVVPFDNNMATNEVTKIQIRAGFFFQDKVRFFRIILRYFFLFLNKNISLPIISWMDVFYVLFNSISVILGPSLMIMNGCVQWNPVYISKDFASGRARTQDC